MGDDKITALIALRDSIISAIRGDDQDAPRGMIAAEYAERVVREDFADALEALTANTENERDALLEVIDQSWEFDRTGWGVIADAILAAGFRRQGDGEATVEWAYWSGIAGKWCWADGESYARNSSALGALGSMPRVRTRTVTPWKEESA